MIGEDLAIALDPVLLALRVGITPDPWQATLLRSTTRQAILLCSRQSGKSTISAVLAVHAAMYHAPALVLVLSPSLRQSQELYRKVRTVFAAVREDAPKLSEESALALEMANGSRIVCLPGKEATIRGFSGVGLLLVDEASRVPDALYQAVRPMLAVSGGRIVLLSTPFGQRGFFYREWSEGGPDWHRAMVPATEVPRISPAWLEAERAQIGDFWWKQEYACEFVQTDDAVFDHAHVLLAVSSDVTPLFAEVSA